MELSSCNKERKRQLDKGRGFAPLTGLSRGERLSPDENHDIDVIETRESIHNELGTCAEILLNVSLDTQNKTLIPQNKVPSVKIVEMEKLHLDMNILQE